jgi:hypothetical protein
MSSFPNAATVTTSSAAEKQHRLSEEEDEDSLESVARGQKRVAVTEHD